jgi:hypothetical protein
MEDNIITINPEAVYIFKFDRICFNMPHYQCTGRYLFNTLIHVSGTTQDGPQQDYLGLLKHDLKQLHTALSRAIEEGDQLKIGIVLGQTVTKLEELSK